MDALPKDARRSSRAHQLVSDWITVSDGKVQISESHARNKLLMPCSRNTVNEGPSSTSLLQRFGSDDTSTLQNAAPTQPDPVTTPPSSSPAGARAACNLMVQTFDVTIQNGKYRCREQACSATFDNGEDVVIHLTTRSDKRELCVLCGR
jgi:hypothetical protein